MFVATGYRSVIRWRLSELMARYKISNKDLAEELERHETSISRMRTSETMPRFDGNDLEKICSALSNLSNHDIGPVDLLERVKDEQSS